MYKIKLLLFLAFFSLILTSCTKKEKLDEVTVKEYLQVKAICTQYNKKEKVLFEGYLAHIYNKTQQSDFRHGTVKYIKPLTKTGDTFVPPSKVSFSKISAKTFTQSFIKTEGLSYNKENRDVFKTFCEITVLKRANHEPKEN